ncbi:retrovirus-related pol polyprotein from transposon TNT 1-94 [Tanacetum coccineum]
MAKGNHSTQAWLWHQRLSHVNFDYINLISKKDVVIGLPKLKYVKDQLYSSCEVSKVKRSSFKSKTIPSLKGRFNEIKELLEGRLLANDYFRARSPTTKGSDLTTNKNFISLIDLQSGKLVDNLLAERNQAKVDGRSLPDAVDCTRKSSSGGIQFLEVNSGVICKLGSSNVDAVTASRLWLHNYKQNTVVLRSQSAIAISCNLVQHSRTKHIHSRYHFIKEQVENGIIELYFVRTEYQLADMFTKALPEERFQYLVRRIGMRCLTPVELEVLQKRIA